MPLFGPHFGRGRHFGRHFSEVSGLASGLLRPAGPATAATFVLMLESGASLSMTWDTDVFKARSGLERRASISDDPRSSITGQVLLNGADTLAVRAQLAQYAAPGQAFAVALPYEETVLTADAVGATIYCNTTGRDWAVIGQGVIVVDWDGTAIEGAIQSVTSSSITLDVAPGAKGRTGARVMPIVPLYLEPQQDFARYPVALEGWQLRGTFALPGYIAAAVSASLSLANPVTSGASTQGVTFRSLLPGLLGNQITVSMSSGGTSGVVVTSPQRRSAAD